MNELAVKLSNRYNIETIIAPLDIQISEAIMNFQENAPNITHHVFQACGGDNNNNQQHLVPVRSPKRVGKRAAIPSSIQASSMRGSGRNRLDKHSFDVLSLGGQLRTAEKNGIIAGASVLSPQDLTHNELKSPIVIDDIKNYMSSTKSFWSSLPNAVCTSNYTLAPNSSIAARKPPKCYSETLASSDINSDVRYRIEFGKYLSDLDTIRIVIEKALRGEEIDFSSNNLGQKQPTIISPFVPNQAMEKPTTTTTTTTTTSEPYPDEPDDDGDDPIEPEDGSGENPIPDPSYDYTSTEFDDPTTETPDDPDMGPEDSTQPQTTSPPFDISTPTNINPEITDNGIALPPDSQMNLTSSQASSKLVISSGNRLLLFSMSVALLIVRYFQTNRYVPGSVC